MPVRLTKDSTTGRSVNDHQIVETLWLQRVFNGSGKQYLLASLSKRKGTKKKCRYDEYLFDENEITKKVPFQRNSRENICQFLTFTNVITIVNKHITIVYNIKKAYCILNSTFFT